MMVDYTIKIDLVMTAVRAAVDSSVHEAVGRFREELGDNAQFVSDIAEAAAMSAVEKFKAMCNSELRLIGLEHGRRASELMMKPPSPIVWSPPADR
jgi:hypothetical protein